MKYKLDELISIKHGYAFAGEGITIEDNNIVLVTPGNFKIGGGFKENKCKFFAGEFPASYILKSDDLIVTMTDLSKEGDSLGYSAKIPNNKKRKYLHNQRIGLINIVSGLVLKDYIYWFMRTRNYQKQILATATGSTVKHTAPKRILEIEIDLPNIERQQKVVNLLNVIENKIELNSKLNDNLEEQIRLLFNKYYESADNETVLSECCNLTSSKRVFAKDYVQEGVPFYRGKEITLKRSGKLLTDMLYISEEHYKEIKKKYGVPNVGDILLTAVGTLGNSYMVQEEKFYFKDGNIIWLKDFRSKEENYYIYDYMQSSLFSNAIESIRIGSTQSALTIMSLGKLKVLIPNESNLREYYKISKAIRDRINANIKETEKLSELRDTLLPKLLSGELDLTNVKLEG